MENIHTIREKARKATARFNSEYRTFRQNSAAGVAHSFEYRRHLIGLKNEVDRFLAMEQAAKNAQ